MTHYAYFEDEHDARAALRLATQRLPKSARLHVESAAVGDQWLLRAVHTAHEIEQTVARELEHVAMTLNGEYDGWERAL